VNLAYQIENLGFFYGTRPVIAVDSFDVAAGEAVALVGPNGSGKTTLLHVLAFVESAQRGKITFFGEPVPRDNLTAFRRRVGLLLQNPYLFHSSVLTNITWGLGLRGIRGDRAHRAARAALDLVGLSGFENRYARSLSGGEAQRVALARALVLEPEVLLLDEPWNHMDRESIRRTEDALRELNRHQGRTLIVTTHHLLGAQSIADRILHLHQGRLIPVAPDNLFRGELGNHGAVFDTGCIEIVLPKPAREATFVAVDPAKIRLSAKGLSEQRNAFHGKIVALAQEHNRIRVTVLAGESFQVLLNSEETSRLFPQLGQQVAVIVPEDAIAVF
jgi:tungstate transport system ATP-binding protein